MAVSGEEGLGRERQRRRYEPSYRRNLPHLRAGGKTYFVTFHTCAGRDLPERARDLVLQHCLHDHGSKCTLLAAVVMPDHVHLVLTPMRDSDGAPYRLREILAGIKGASAHSVNRLLRVRGSLWQAESFDHIIRWRDGVSEKIRYICENPVRKRLVADHDDYPWLWDGE